MVCSISRAYMQVSGGYQFVHAYVVDSSAALIGKRVPEVPRHQFTWSAYWHQHA